MRHTTIPDEALGQVDLDALASAHGIVGAALAVSSGRHRSVSAVGVTRPGGPPVVRSVRFGIASVTKALVATVVAATVDDGLLGSDTRVVDVLPRFAHRAITVDQLLTHTSALPDQWPTGDDAPDTPDALEQFVDGLVRLELQAEPGTRFSYSNAGYAVLGRLLEVVHGHPFEAVLQHRLFDPLGLRATFCPADVVDELLARGSLFDAATRRPGPLADVQGARALAAAGSRLYATPDDLLTFGELHLAVERGRSMRRPLPGIDVLRRMHEPLLDIPDPRHGRRMARGLLVDDTWGTPVLLHDGGALGQSAFLRIVPEHDTVIALFATGGVPQTFHRAVFAELVPALLDRQVAPDVTVDDARDVDVQRYIGRYTSPMLDVEIAASDGAATGVGSRGAPPAPMMVTLHPAGGTPVGPLPLGAVDEHLFLAPLDGRPYSIAFEDGPHGTASPAVAVLAGLRRLVRSDQPPLVASP